MPTHQDRALPRWRSTGLSAALLALLAVLLLPAPRTTAQTPDDGCDQSEPIACLTLPDAGGVQPAAPAAVAPQIVPPAPGPSPWPWPWPCLTDPLAVMPDTPVSPAIVPPQPPSLIPPIPSYCPHQDVIARVNQYNAVYVRAARTLNTAELPKVAEGQALTLLRDYIAMLRSRGTYLTLRMNSIRLTGFSFDPGSGACPPDATVCTLPASAILPPAGLTARITTVEHWTYEERALGSGALLVRNEQHVQNLYELRRRDGVWMVFRNEIAPADQPPPWGSIAPGYPPAYPPAPVPPYPEPPTSPSAQVSVTLDRSSYRVGDPIVATATNTGSVTVSGGGGYRCGLIGLEIDGPSGWRPAPGGSEVCTLIALLLRPGETKSETFTAPTPGRYRLVVRVSSEYGDGGPFTFYSAPFTVR